LSCLFLKIGTTPYKAPEILLREYMFLHFTPAVDIWAAALCIAGMVKSKRINNLNLFLF